MTLMWEDRSFLFLSGVLRALEARGLTPGILDRLLGAGSISDAVKILDGTLYQGTGGTCGIETRLNRRRESFYALVACHAPDADLVGLIGLPYDIHNIKLALKDKINGSDHNDLMLAWGAVPLSDLSGVFEEESYSHLPGSLGGTVEQAIELYFSDNRPAIIDLVLDRAMHHHALDLCRNLKNETLAQYFRLRIDGSNLRMLVRSRLYIGRYSPGEMFVDHGTLDTGLFSEALDRHSLIVPALRSHRHWEAVAGVLALAETEPLVFERETDNVLTRFWESYRFDVSGIHAVYAHVYAVELELRILGLVLAAVEKGLDRNWMEQRLPALFGGAS